MQAAVDFIRGVGNSLRKTPAFMWVYLAVVIYLYKRMSRDFLGMGSRNVRVLGKTKVNLTVAEERMAESVVNPSDLKVRFEDIGGLEDVKDSLREHVVWPFTRPDLFPEGSLRAHPTGMLLHGPPGTGKTLLARALAKELNGHFIEVCVEKLFAKYVGESEKMAAAVFSVAEKLEPTVIFVDEIDSLLSSRTDADTTVYLHAKTIFLTKWDGLQSAGGKVIVIGATNRPNSLDQAVLRRMPIRLHVPLPDVASRLDILKIHLDKERLAPDFNLSALATLTEGYSGSDLKELCKAAAMGPLREVMKRSDGGAPTGAGEVPPLAMCHFQQAMSKVTGRQYV